MNEQQLRAVVVGMSVGGRIKGSMPTSRDDAAIARAVIVDLGNPEILAHWLEILIHRGYRDADAALEAFLGTIGRRKFLMPLYDALLVERPG